MTGHDTHTHFLMELPPAERDAELREELRDSLQELVACIERSLPLDGNTLHSCVIDEFQILRSQLREDDCCVLVRFNASARQGIGNGAWQEHIAGAAEAVIDEQGWVSYRNVQIAEEPAFVGHDLGGGD